MRLRSTGLGRTELEAKIIDVKRVDDVVIFYVTTTKPVKRHLRAGMQFGNIKGYAKASCTSFSSKDSFFCER